jgi:WD40 repeat protein
MSSVTLADYPDQLVSFKGQLYAALSTMTGEIWSGSLLVLSEKGETKYQVELDHGATSLCVCESGDRKVVCVATDGAKLEVVVETAEGATLDASLAGHDASLTGVAGLAGARAVSVSRDMSARIWDVGAQKGVAHLDVHEGAITSCASDGEEAFATFSQSDRQLHLWDAQAPQRPAQSCRSASEATSVALSASSLYLGLAGGSIEVWDRRQLSEPAQILQGGHRSAVRVLVGGAQLVSGADDGAVRLWSGAESRVLLQRPDSVRGLARTAGGWACAAWDKTISFVAE